MCQILLRIIPTIHTDIQIKVIFSNVASSHTCLVAMLGHVARLGCFKGIVH
jgi:hypothetical protein